jgi:hypothetical protein
MTFSFLQEVMGTISPMAFWKINRKLLEAMGQYFPWLFVSFEAVNSSMQD